MTYSEISIVAPDSAPAGSLVSGEVKIKNLVDFSIYGQPVLRIDGIVLDFSYQQIYPGTTRSWSFSFTMPSNSVTVKAESWIEQEYFGIPWHLDATAQKTISLPKVPAPEFSGFGVTDYSTI